MKLALLLSLASAACAADLRIQVADESGKPIWTRLEVRGADGSMHQPAGAIVDKVGRAIGGEAYYLKSFVIQGECRLDVPAGQYTVIGEHGLEYERVERRVTAPAEVNLQLKPWIRMRERGWWSADFHVHRPPDDAPALSLAEDLNLNVVFTMWNKRKALPADPLVRTSPHHLITLMNAEDERGGGAWMLHNLRDALPLGVDGRWFPPGIRFVEQARAQRAWFDCEKPIWWEVPVMMALARPDSFGVLHNHFNQYGVRDEEAWGRPRDQQKFPGREGFVEYTMGLYYRYLNLGMRLPPSAGSASGVLPNPVGYNRIYAKLDGPFTVEAWYAAFRDGRSFVTNGPILFFDLKRSGSRATASVEALAREPIDRVEIVANGKVIHRFPASKGEFTFDARSYSWVAARCFLKPGSTIRLAHSAPVHLEGRYDASADARYFLDWIDELIAQTTADPKRFAQPAERDEVLALYRRAREFYMTQ